MADKWIGDLTAASTMGNQDLFVISQSGEAKKVTWSVFFQYLQQTSWAHGGISNITYTAPASGSVTGTITITFGDNTTTTLPLTNGRAVASIAEYWALSESAAEAPQAGEYSTTVPTMSNEYPALWHYSVYSFNDSSTPLTTTPAVVGVYGTKGDTGDASYCYIRYAVTAPSSDEEVETEPDNWMGIYTGTESDPENLHYDDYDWFEIKGETGTGISDISYEGSSGLVDTYRIQYDDSPNHYRDFTVTNGEDGEDGSNIASIERAANPDAETGANSLRYTYTVTLTDNTSTSFKVFDGNGIQNVTKVTSGLTDTYTLHFQNGDTYSFNVKNGADGQGSVSTVDSLPSVSGDVALLTLSNRAPLTTDPGQVKSRWYDQTNHNLYICTAVGGTQANPEYAWSLATSSISVDSSLSSSSHNPVENATLTALLGTTTLTTASQNVTGAIVELKSAINTGSFYYTPDQLGFDSSAAGYTPPTMTQLFAAMPSGSTGIFYNNQIDQTGLTQPSSGTINTIIIVKPVISRCIAIGARNYNGITDGNCEYAFASFDNNANTWHGWFTVAKKADVQSLANTAVDNALDDELRYAVNDTMSSGTVSVSIFGSVHNETKTSIMLDVVTEKSMANISSVTVTSMSGYLRGVGGNIDGGSVKDFIASGSGYTVSATKQLDNHVRINITKSSAFTNSTAFTPVTYFGRIGLKFT